MNAGRNTTLIAGSSVLLLVYLIFFKSLWLAERSFPAVPVFSFLMLVPAYVHETIYYLCILSTLSGVLLCKRWPMATSLFIVFIFGLSCCLDILRLQPSIYLALIVLALSLIDKSIVAMQMAFCLIYIWAGFQKLNHQFIFPGFKNLMSNLSFEVSLQWIPVLAVCVAVFEIMIGILLIFKKTRTTGLLLATGMHLIILLLLGPLFLNFEPFVWPWNLWMILAVWILFYKADYSPATETSAAAFAVVALLFFAAPISNLFGWWNDYLSFKFYSSNTRGAAIRLHTGSSWQENELFKNATVQKGRINIAQWGVSETGATEFPNEWYYTTFFAKTCVRLKAPNDDKTISLIMSGIPDRFTGRTERKEVFCSEVNQRF